MIQKKSKTCSKCNKEKLIFSNKTVNGEKMSLCQVCSGIVKKELDKEKRKVKREKKREVITEKKLDTLVSKVIRTLYGDKCVTCGNIGTFSTNHCGHAISRQFRATRFNPENLGSQCPRCNLWLQGAQYEYGKFINMFHGEGTMEKLIELSKSDIRIGTIERKELWKIYQEALEHQDLEKLIKQYYNLTKTIK